MHTSPGRCSHFQRISLQRYDCGAVIIMLKLLAQVVKIMLLRQLKDHPSEYNYNNVKRWTNRHFNRNLKTVTNPNLNIFEFDEVLVPMNHENSHWYLAVIYMTEKRILNYDSLQSLGIDERSVLLRFVNCREIAADLNYCPSLLPSPCQCLQFQVLNMRVICQILMRRIRNEERCATGPQCLGHYVGARKCPPAERRCLLWGVSLFVYEEHVHARHASGKYLLRLQCMDSKGR